MYKIFVFYLVVGDIQEQPGCLVQGTVEEVKEKIMKEVKKVL